MEHILRFLKAQKIFFVENYNTASHSTFRIGGVAALAVFPCDREQMIGTLSLLKGQGLPFEILGNGSNVLFAFDRYEGVLVFTDRMDAVRCEGNTLICECGASLTALSRRAAELGLSGLEFAYGIPGTVGGAVFMNAGAYGSSVSAVLTESEAYDCETDAHIHLQDHHFGYRKSIYMESAGLVCLDATFELKPDDKEQIRMRMQNNMDSRREKQPLSYPSAGSYFKRPEGYFAGKLIEDAGLKGTRVGDAQVSEKHAGFLINLGKATAADILALETLVCQEVKTQFGVTLEREVQVIK